MRLLIGMDNASSRLITTKSCTTQVVVNLTAYAVLVIVSVIVSVILCYATIIMNWEFGMLLPLSTSIVARQEDDAYLLLSLFQQSF